MIIFLYGTDTYRSRNKLRELQCKFFNEVDKQGYNLTTVSGHDGTVEKIVDALMAAPFMATKRMVVLEEYSAMSLSEKQEQGLLEVVEKVLGEDTIFVVWEAGLSKKDLAGSFFKTIQKSKYIMPFESWNQQQVAGWMAQELQSAGVSIDGDALQYLSLSVNDDLWLASSEVNKLIHYAKAKDLKIIDKSTVSTLVTGGVRDSIFDLVDAVSAGNQKNALERLHDQIEAGSHELEINGMLVRQYRLLQQVKDGLDTGAGPDIIAQTYGIHPFVVKKMSSQARRVSQDSIKDAYREITAVDLAIKSSGLSSALLLSTAVAKLSSTSRA